ncbi:hypothetical protein Pyn_41158 [Prunus yedoensis var. nudiflora]|uniref:Uncharacterized protein n=1 Tax=Prunus yedoensis var. nudiflora TaxID=2094558 RepID=A0A314Y8W9_PRUYE|nr:hypothetical protein Pyn_41158 [Prunus yedoensis var. nudiflora]
MRRWGANTKAVVEYAKKATEESNKKRVEAVRALELDEVEKAELAKEAEKWRVKSTRLSEENVCLQRAVENACQSQVEDVKQFLDSAEVEDSKAVLGVRA